MRSSFDEFENNKISILTYNYDRSFEHFLYLSLKNSFGKSDQEVAEKIGKLPIIHVHGKVGNLDWQDEKGWPYHPDPNLERIKLVSQMINIISEIKDEEKFFAKSWEILQESERIIFLGFGFHRENIERLKLNELSNDIGFHASAHGFTENEKSEIKAIFLRMDKTIHLGRLNQDALEYLRAAIIFN